MKYEKRNLENQTNAFLTLLLLERNLSPKTIKAYQCDLHCFIAWCEEQQLKQLDSNTVLAYFEYLYSTAALKSRTIQRKYITLHQFFNYLNSEGYTHERFLRFSTRKFQTPHSIPKTLSSPEIKSLISCIDRQYESEVTPFRRTLCIRDNAMIELLFCAGLRIGELSSLDLEHFNHAERTLLIKGKGNKERLLYISSTEVLEKLYHWIQSRSFLNPTSAALFINRYGERLSIYGIEKVFKKYRNLSLINQNSTPHYLRHSFATQLLNNGASIRDVQELLGHASIVTTQIYTEVSINRKKLVLTQYNGRNFLFQNS